MTLFITNDGMFGWQIDNEPIKWFNSEYQAKMYGLIQFECDIDNEYEVKNYMEEFHVALDTMREKRHTKAEFNILGDFLYTMEEGE